MYTVHAHLKCTCMLDVQTAKKFRPKAKARTESLQHLLFTWPGGHPSKVWDGPVLLNFHDLLVT